MPARAEVLGTSVRAIDACRPPARSSNASRNGPACVSCIHVRMGWPSAAFGAMADAWKRGSNQTVP